MAVVYYPERIPQTYAIVAAARQGETACKEGDMGCARHLKLSHCLVIGTVLVSLSMLPIHVSVAEARGIETRHGKGLSVTAAPDGPATVQLDVPFETQLFSDTWAQTNNCGQASAAMVFSYLRGTVPTEDDIKKIDDWLFVTYGDPVNNYNGSPTSPTELEALARVYGGFTDSYSVGGWDLTRLKQEIDAGDPVIVKVVASYLSNRGYAYSGDHAVVVCGYNDTDMICNDPNTAQGQGILYANSEFSEAMSAGGGYVVVVKGHNAQTQPSSPANAALPFWAWIIVGVAAIFIVGGGAWLVIGRREAAKQ